MEHDLNTEYSRRRGLELSEPQSEEGGSLSIQDLLTTLFRHKWLILAFLGLGLLAALTVRVIRPPNYVSWAKLMVLYVEPPPGVNPPSPEGHVSVIDANAMNSQIEILKSGDVARRAAVLVGPARIMAKRGGGSNEMAATAVIYSSTEVENPRGTAILNISFRHTDRDLVQPALEAIVATFMKKHQEVYRRLGVLDEYYEKQSEETRAKLAKTDEELKKIRTNVLVVSIEETKKSFQAELTKWHEELHLAQVDLDTHKAMLGDASSTTVTNAEASAHAQEKLLDYTDLLRELDSLKKNEIVLARTYKSAFPLLMSTRAQIKEMSDRKLEMEQAFPLLPQMAAAAMRGGTNSGATDFDEIRKLTARVASINQVVSNITAEAKRVLDLEPRIAELQRQRNAQETNYQYFATAFQRTLVDRDLGAGKSSMSEVQSPTEPDLDRKKYYKLIGGAFGFFAAMGLGLAFVIDFVIRRTIRRATDVERHMQMPVFLTIPDSGWDPRRLTWPGGNSGEGGKASAKARRSDETKTGSATAEMPITLWRAGHPLQRQFEGLRERLMAFFEANQLNHKMPKLVGVTGCAKGAGVTTLATGLAAALSETGTGNVLLVDLNAEHESAQTFFRGKSEGQLTEGRAPESLQPVDQAATHEHRPLARIKEPAPETNNDRLARSLPASLVHLAPKLRADDYDYIIFDLPPIGPTTVTPRLSNHMDLVLAVVESEKTGQHLAVRASKLLKSSRARVAAVLNKHRQHLPAALAHDD